ncbi:hypothetical protein, partial [Ruminococcus sp.]|uniref:hypothetical protein n=1 Tax=Ruminococcus sp. TaxID=41978 RepID=UPI001AFCEB9D
AAQQSEVRTQSYVREKARGQASRQQACGSLRAEPSITEAQSQNAHQAIKAKQNQSPQVG